MKISNLVNESIDLNTASEAEQIAAVQKKADTIKRIKNPSEAVQLAAVKSHYSAIAYIPDPSEAVQLAAVQGYGFVIARFPNPSEAVQMAAVKRGGSAIEFIKNPSEAVQMAAVKSSYSAIRYIPDPSEEVQLAAVKAHANAIQYIENPSAEVLVTAILVCIKNKEITKARLVLRNLKATHPDTPEIAKLDSVLNSSSEPEQINELTPYRSNPDYQKAREIFADPEPYPLNRRRKTKLATLTAWLEQHGFKNVGQGSFGAVYEKSGYPWVFKVFNNDPAYMHFLRYAMAHQSNPHLPKIRGVMKIDDKTYVVRMENLKQIPLGLEPATTLVRQIHNMDSYGDLSEKQVEWIKKHLPGIHQFFMTFPLGGYEYDIHYDNLMMRGNTIVIVDPLYDWHGMEGDE